MTINHPYYIGLASAASNRSKCVSLHVGCVIVLNDRVISTGVNGTAPGSVNCCDKFPDGKTEEHSEWSQKYEVHAEMSALLQADCNIAGSTAYVTHSPCFNCLKHLIWSGVKSIYFSEKYHRMSDDEWSQVIEYCNDTSTGLVQLGETFHYHVIGVNEVRELFQYKDGILYWNERPSYQFESERICNGVNTRFAGEDFGAPHGHHKATYIRGNILGNLYLAHRLIWLYVNGVNPRHQIDHIDGNGLNNKIENLRDVPNSVNARNHPIRNDNKSGKTGVRKSKSGRWIVTINSQYCGMRDTYEEAVEFRCELELKHKYHENHGRINEV